MINEKDLEKLQMLLAGELDGKEKAGFLEEIRKNPELNNEYEELKEILNSVSEAVNSEPRDGLLSEARAELRGALRTERNKRSLLRTAADAILNFIHNHYRSLSVAAATLVIGIFIGRQLFRTEEPAHMNATQQLAESSSPAGRDTLPDASAEKSAEVSAPEEKPSAPAAAGRSDGQSRYLFASGTNAGKKLNRLGEILTESMNKKELDPKLQNALVHTVKTDDNPGVRRAALNALLQCRYNAKIKDALIYVLSNDKNSGLRVASINALIDNEKNGRLDRKLYDALSKKTANENNEYIRMRAKAALKEVTL